MPISLQKRSKLSLLIGISVFDVYKTMTKLVVFNQFIRYREKTINIYYTPNKKSPYPSQYPLSLSYFVTVWNWLLYKDCMQWSNKKLSSFTNQKFLHIARAEYNAPQMCHSLCVLYNMEQLHIFWVFIWKERKEKDFIQLPNNCAPHDPQQPTNQPLCKQRCYFVFVVKLFCMHILHKVEFFQQLFTPTVWMFYVYIFTNFIHHHVDYYRYRYAMYSLRVYKHRLGV